MRATGTTHSTQTHALCHKKALVPVYRNHGAHGLIRVLTLNVKDFTICAARTLKRTHTESVRSISRVDQYIRCGVGAQKHNIYFYINNVVCSLRAREFVTSMKGTAEIYWRAGPCVGSRTLHTLWFELTIDHCFRYFKTQTRTHGAHARICIRACGANVECPLR